MICEANRAAAGLLGIPSHFLVGKLLTLYLNQRDCSGLQGWLSTLKDEKPHTRKLTLYPRDRKPFDVEVVIAVVRDHRGHPDTLRWLIRDVSDRYPLVSLDSNGHNFSTHYIEVLQQNRFVHTYNRREMISLETNNVWLVIQGLVKLTTPIDGNSEVVTGLIGPGMIFGAYFTSLSLYQAVALSESHLVAIAMEEVINSPPLSQLFFVVNARRLRQAEVLLAIAGERYIKDRLYRLLELLKQEMSEAIAEGSRLTVRLTHEDLANACGSTRATITRLMGELQQQGKILVDDQCHIILTKSL